MQSLVQSPVLSSARFLLAGLAIAALLAGCGSKKEPQADASDGDPALTGALAGQIMADPDLSGQKGAAVSPGSPDIELPPELRNPEAIAAAKADAIKLAGGMLKPAPAPAQGGVNQLVERAATAAQVAEAARVGKVNCSGKVEYSMKWANALPPALAVYPRGAVQEAAGTDSDGCSLRVINFVTPVAPGDVLDFYYTRLSAAGYSSEHRVDGQGGQVLGGGKGVAAYLVFARPLDNGLTEVDLVSGGE